MASPPTSTPSPPGLEAVLGLVRDPVIERLSATVRADFPQIPVHLVGGRVRDAWLGRPSHDLDVVVSGRGAEISKRLAEVLAAHFVPLGGKEFAAFRLVGEGFEVDLWDREAMSVTEDLARRDLTLNSIALDLEAGTVTDPFGGLEDLARRRLRATTETSFSGDPLRVLRLARMVAQLPEFESEPATRELARQAVPGLNGIAAERIRDELGRIFSTDEATDEAADGTARGLRELAAIGVYPWLFEGEGWQPEAVEIAAERAALEIEALPAAAERLAELRRESGPAEVERPDLPPLDLTALDLTAARWASVLLHLPSSGSAGPGDRAESVLQGLVDRGFLSRRAAGPVLSLVGEPQPPVRIEGLPPTIPAGGEIETRLALHRLGALWPTALVAWGARAAASRSFERSLETVWPSASPGSWEATVRKVLTLLDRDGEQILDPPRLLNGTEVKELLGIAAGPELGRALAAVRRAQVEGKVRTREEAVTYLAELSGRSLPTSASPRPSDAG